MAEYRYDLVLIGGGTAALAAVSEALDQGVGSIALIEKREELGGECALNACVPTKTLLTAAKLIKDIEKRAPHYGIEVLHKRLNYQKLRAKVDEIIYEGEYEFMKDPRVTRFHGTAVFIDKQTVQVNEAQIRGDQIIIATGSEPVIPAVEGLQDVGFITFEAATHLQELPASLLILGGGPVGVEFAQLLQWLGVEVTLIQRGERLLPNEEPEISQAVQALLESEGVKVQLHSSIEQARCEHRDQNGKQMKCFKVLINASEQEFIAEEILVATGNKPRIEGLHLEITGVQTNHNGIIVDDELRTANPHIWAIGDVIGQYEFTHVADYHATLAIRNAFTNAHKKVDYRGLGWAVFTSPTIAHVGLTEVQAREQYDQVEVVTSSTDKVSRYRIESQTEGFIKLIIDGRTNRLVGAHLFASEADDIVHTLMLGIQRDMTIEQLLDVIYIYPSKAQIIQKPLEKYLSQKIKTEQCVVIN